MYNSFRLKSSPSNSEAAAPTRIQSVSRAARLLVLAAKQRGGTTAAQGAAELRLSVPTTHHLLNTLVDEGLLARDAQRRYVVGPRVAVLADAFVRDGDVPEYLMAPLRRLATETKETAYLSAWRGHEIHALASIEGENAVRVVEAERGPYRFAHARATGKLLLAFGRSEQVAAVLGAGPLEALTPRTIVDPVALDAELARIRRRGFADDREEFAEGVCCLSAPLMVDGVLVAAFTVSSPLHRFARDRSALLAAVRAAAKSAARRSHDSEAS